MIAITDALTAQDGDLEPVTPYREPLGVTGRTAGPVRREPRAGLARFCSIDTSTRPGRTAAGGAGVLVVTVTARPGFAIAARELLEVDCVRAQGSLRLDPFEVLRGGPTDGADATDYLVLGARFEVHEHAATGEHPIALTLSAGITERPGDRLLGLLFDPVSTTVVVGPPPPTPPLPTPGSASSAPPALDPAPRAPVGRSSPGSAPLAAATVDVAGDGGERSSHAPLDPANMSRTDLAWIGLGACALFAYILIILRRLLSPRP